jgi:hypothetical protein
MSADEEPTIEQLLALPAENPLTDFGWSGVML